MKKRYLVTLTKGHVRRGRMQEATMCPIALALRGHFRPCNGAAVGMDSAIYKGNEVALTLKHSKKVQELIGRVDRGEKSKIKTPQRLLFVEA